MNKDLINVMPFINLCFCGEDAYDKYIANIQKCKKFHGFSVDMVKSNDIKEKLMQKVAETNEWREYIYQMYKRS